MNTYLCRTPDDSDEYARAVGADDINSAAVRFCEYRDQVACDYPDEQQVVVICPDRSRATVTVLAASVREYWVPRKRGATCTN